MNFTLRQLDGYIEKSETFHLQQWTTSGAEYVSDFQTIWFETVFFKKKLNYFANRLQYSDDPSERPRSKVVFLAKIVPYILK